MRFAQLLLKHTAYQKDMQVAYARKMEKSESLRRARRRKRLEELLSEFGGAAQVARESGTPKSHFSAMLAAKRGLGDELAEKLEILYAKPRGWFDLVVIDEAHASNSGSHTINEFGAPSSAHILASTATPSGPTPPADYSPEALILAKWLDKLPTGKAKDDVFSACMELLNAAVRGNPEQTPAPAVVHRHGRQNA